MQLREGTADVDRMDTTGDTPMRCECGRLKGVARGLAPSTGIHVVCYCDDCQAYAHALGRAELLLDAHGGSANFLSVPSRLRLTEGGGQLACMRLTEKGLLRWYARCCRTPVANTLPWASLPFVSIPIVIFDNADRRDAELGPVRYRVHGKFAVGEPAGASAGVPFGCATRVGSRIVAGFVRGDARPSPFFDASGEPVVEPTVGGPA